HHCRLSLSAVLFDRVRTMDISCGISVSFKSNKNCHVSNIMWTLAGCLASTVIIFASLGSIQNQCRNEDPDLLTDIAGFSGGVLGCKKLYRYYWFITALNLVTAVFGLWSAATGALSSRRMSILGLLVIANLLTINMTNAFYSILDIPKWQDGVGRDRSHTMVAGCIITAVFQCAAIFLVGMEECPTFSCCAESCKAKACPVEPKEDTKPVETAPAPVAEVEAPAVPAAAEQPIEEPLVPNGESAVAVSVQ
ncbi:hypothetical protein Agub_g9201, partial [Astrephomene gubernaculifera]